MILKVLHQAKYHIQQRFQIMYLVLKYMQQKGKVDKQYQELEKIGLAAPQVTYIMHDLKEIGLPVKVNVTTVEEAADEIMQALEKKI